jgi:uncharacterized membrane protein HdeD (DUF308 family)
MGILMMILGVLLIVLGICCAVTPLTTLVAAGYFIAAVLIVSGVSGIIAGLKYKLYGSNLIVSILALVLGVIALVKPGGIQTIDTILIYLFAAWLVLRGISSISLSLKLRKLELGNDWILGLIVGILGIALGIYSFVHPSVPAVTIGLLIAFYFIETGIDTIAMGRVVKEVTDTVDSVEQEVAGAVASIEKEINDTVDAVEDAINSADSNK